MTAPTIGRVGFSIVIDRLHVGCEVSCLRCSDRFTPDAAALAMTIDREVVGYVCASCLSPTMRERLANAERGKAGAISSTTRPPVCWRQRHQQFYVQVPESPSGEDG